MRLFSDSIGRKAVVAVTGLFMVLFVVVHLLGNSDHLRGTGRHQRLCGEAPRSGALRVGVPDLHGGDALSST